MVTDEKIIDISRLNNFIKDFNEYISQFISNDIKNNYHILMTYLKKEKLNLKLGFYISYFLIKCHLIYNDVEKHTIPMKKILKVEQEIDDHFKQSYIKLKTLKLIFNPENSNRHKTLFKRIW